DELLALQLLGELLGDIVVQRMHQRLPPSVAAEDAARRPRARPVPDAVGASGRLFSAAFTAGELRLRTSSSTGLTGVVRAFHFPSAPSTQNTSSTPWAMARLRSVAHFGTTRSGLRCIARCAQSYLPAASSSHLAFSSFCQVLH